MKKYYALVIITFISLSAFAQKTIPNPSFDNWSNDTVKTITTTKVPYQNPIGWVTPDSLTLYYGGATEVTQSDTVYGSCKYAARLETRAILTFGVPGFVLLGKINIDINTRTGSITGGVPFTARPDSLYGYYRYVPASGTIDSCFAYLYLFHRVSQTQNDTVAVGIFKSGDTVTSYTKFSMPINYLTGETPDTLQLVIASSSQFLNSPPAGSVMFVDSLTFSTDTSAASGINTIIDKGFGVSCYPNPANKNINVLISEPRPGMLIEVYDALGRNILSTSTSGLITSIDVSKLPGGLYFYEVLDKDGNSLKSDKFTVAR